MILKPNSEDYVNQSIISFDTGHQFFIIKHKKKFTYAQTDCNLNHFIKYSGFQMLFTIQ